MDPKNQKLSPPTGASDEKQLLKKEGLAFGRCLQTVLKTVIMYSVDHPAVERGLQQAFATLNNLAKQTGQFTFGFLNHRVLVGSVLTDDPSLAQLEQELTRRGVGTLAFSAGISKRDFKRALALISTKPQLIEERGGIGVLMQQNAIPGVRIIPRRKPSKEDEDLTLGMDVDSYQLAQEIMGPAGGGGNGLDLLCQAAGLEKTGSSVSSASAALEIASQAVQSALTNPETDPRGVLRALTRWLEELPPGFLLAALPAGRQDELRERPMSETATELMEDVVVTSVVRRLGAPQEGMGPVANEEEVAKQLYRGLRATRVAERLLRKLARFLQDAGMPAEVYERLRGALAWYALSPPEQRQRLLQIEHFSELDFRRLVGYVKDRMDEEKLTDALEVAEHCVRRTLSESVPAQTEQLTRLPELFRAIASLSSLDFLRQGASELCQRLERGPSGAPDHLPLVSCLVALANIFGSYEELQPIQMIGATFERISGRNPMQHESCCGVALKRLVSPAATQRLVELFLAKRDDPDGTKTVALLLKWLGPTAAENVATQLEEETAAPNRMRLMRLMTQLGTTATESATKRLEDSRWYVVRNACQILGDLGCPDLPQVLRSALRHSDPRVQMAAVKAIVGTKGADRAPILADALADLRGAALDMVLDELLLYRDPACVESLIRFVSTRENLKVFTLEKVFHALGSISSDPALQFLGGVLTNSSTAPPVRNAARRALERSPSPVARQLLSNSGDLRTS